MKTILALAALCLALAVANALTITEAEYFVNADPGAGFGSPISITPGESVSIPALFVPTNSLTAHLSHRLYLRFPETLRFLSPRRILASFNLYL